ncbi:MAG: hypothetical protein MUE99_09395 [Chitinophagaceae bacterium]|nr:hypothetical protein [Chitinophagaceae bacterium]
MNKSPEIHIPDISGTGIFLKACATVFVIYTLSQNIEGVWVKMFVLLFSLIIYFIYQKPLLSRFFWIFWLLYFLNYLFFYYPIAANHHFTGAYLSAAIIIFLLNGDENERILQFHIRFMVAAILIASALHKALSPTFISGEYFQLETSTGEFLKPIKNLFSSWKNAADYNASQLNDLFSVPPDGVRIYAMMYPFNGLNAFAKVSSFMAIFIETLAGILIFRNPHKKSSHLIYSLMIAGVFVFRLETGFLSMLCAMGILLAPNIFYRNIYLIMMSLFLALMASGIGLP